MLFSTAPVMGLLRGEGEETDRKKSSQEGKKKGVNHSWSTIKVDLVLSSAINGALMKTNR